MTNGIREPTSPHHGILYQYKIENSWEVVFTDEMVFKKLHSVSMFIGVSLFVESDKDGESD